MSWKAVSCFDRCQSVFRDPEVGERVQTGGEDPSSHNAQAILSICFLQLVAIKSVVPSKQLAEEHYKDLSKKPFFASLVKYVSLNKDLSSRIDL